LGTGGSLKVKLHDKLKALDALGKHLGMFIDRIKDETERPAVILGEPLTIEQWVAKFSPDTEVAGHGG
jgi:hypothetical protein